LVAAEEEVFAGGERGAGGERIGVFVGRSLVVVESEAGEGDAGAETIVDLDPVLAQADVVG